MGESGILIVADAMLVMEEELRRRAGEVLGRQLSSHEAQAARKVAELLAVGCRVDVCPIHPAGMVTAIDETESSSWKNTPEALRVSREPTRLLGFHSDAERNAFFARLERARGGQP